ncbi:dipeptide/oligopeptide/nickel ABC transporter ATP-binding protein [Haloferax gibbonsii ATCC 33959]|uniref:Dipeptide/oligopeptide/nickel ABC transporter ATP-binding protein n=1 Tax=Haloferax gibbonsii (strain ATCC 33959 / DSM 4427 / JCM 8863 / NBRC 102184 / NCIMB 2188 / Ma 2.38) TaxID=1227459 RepID=M0HN69_HALGM|nr:ABC transporter ATP-binding protein [Haloferax gibbonsii]ELZ85233.1 dipeptide/oligopeptide/nickel ABC transporter ATP-binding protein [Haloferax gibbonsii ATCC 33959]
MSDTLLTVRDLHTHFRTDAGTVRAVDGISFEVQRGEVLGLVGESGAGKSVAARSIMRLIDSPGVIVNGEVRFEDDLLVGVERGDDPDDEPRQDPEMLSSREIRERIRGREIAMIFQDPTESLNPVFTVGEQLSEIIGLNRDVSAVEAEAIAVERLREVGIPEAERRMDDYPHEFSGGMRQRVLIAMAFACEPSLVVADEPTTALDVTVEAQILDLVKDLAARYDTSFVWVTHDMGVVAEICDRVAVMYLGEIVEQATVDDLFHDTKHPYTEALLGSIPRPDRDVDGLSPIEGIMPEAINPPSGCRFHTRCPHAREACLHVHPDARLVDEGGEGDGDVAIQAGDGTAVTEVAAAPHRAACLRNDSFAEAGYWESAPLDDAESASGSAATESDSAETGDAAETGTGSTFDPDADPLLSVRDLRKYFDASDGFLDRLRFDRDAGLLPFSVDREYVRAVDGVSFDILPGETLGLVGESGCGKSTLARTLLRLVDPTSGDIVFDGENLAELSKEELRKRRKRMQFVFQDPQASLDPRMTVGEIVEEPMQAHGLYEGEREARARELLETVGLDADHYNRYPHQFSGGQRQRVNLARALSVDPDFIVCDEPTSALDASVQAQVLNTMKELQDEFGLTYLFISHDLSVIRHVCDRVAVMYLGELVELADKDDLFESPKHPYTRALLSSIPVPDPRVSRETVPLSGDVPSPIHPPSGCRFHTRCPSLVAPEDLDLGDEDWDRVRRFVRAVQRESPDVVADDARATYFPDGLPAGDAGTTVERALSLAAGGAWRDAASLLTETFVEPSVCTSEVPALDSPDELDRIVSCHHYS